MDMHWNCFTWRFFPAHDCTLEHFERHNTTLDTEHQERLDLKQCFKHVHYFLCLFLVSN